MDLYWMMTAIAATIGIAMAITARAAPRIAARLFIALAAAGLAFFIVQAFRRGEANYELEVMMSIPWGQTTLADLYLSFAFLAVIIFAFERHLASALFWALPMFVLGHIWTAIWLIVRLPTLMNRMKAGTEARVSRTQAQAGEPPLQAPAPEPSELQAAPQPLADRT